RVGLHVGAVVLRGNNDEDVARGAKPLEVHGIAKPTAARVMALALGGQTLLTAAARDALGETALHIHSHGHWRLKGVPEPLELFELGNSDAGFTAPPDSDKAYRVVRGSPLWLPLREIRHSLPAERDAFVGRVEPLADLERRFDAGARLVSLLGMGGTGKTRLATYFAWTHLGDFQGGVWFCDLSQARDINGIAHAVALGLEVPLGKDDPVVQLGFAIAGRTNCLVILDNFEQVARYAEETLGRWLDRAAEAKFIVTTREVLGLQGEETLALTPLPVTDAVTLFTRRALAAKYDFAPNDDDQLAIPQLVKLLDGLPLAVELAAARVRVMSPRMLLARMDQRFRLLAVGGGRHDRQATLRTTFDWSWDLLSAAEKAALAQLSVFDGGFTFESAEAVLELPAAGEQQWTVDMLQSLVDKSFVRSVSDTRFDLLVSVQEYAAEHLRTLQRYPESGPEALAAAQSRHFTYFASVDIDVATAEGCVELGNLVAACRRAAATAEASVAAAILERAWEAIELRGPFKLGAELAALVHAIPGLRAANLAQAGRIAGAALQASGDVVDAKRQFESALASARDAGEPMIEGRLHSHLGDVLAIEGQAEEADKHYAIALETARRLGDRRLECAALNGLGNTADAQGLFNAARTHYEIALTVARDAGDRRWEGGLLGNLGNVKANLGAMNEARTDYESALHVAREVGDRSREGNTLSNLGLLNLVQGRLAVTQAQFEAALLIAREMGHRRLECIVLCNLGIVQDAQGRVSQAQANFEQALAVAQELADHTSQGQSLGYLGLSHARQGRFDVARECFAAGELLLQKVSDPTSLALLQCARAEAEFLAGRLEVARLSARYAEKLARGAGAGSDSELGVALTRIGRLIDPR
ncbi:MAG: tetratricopeptide repeat protein, partial [Burkholderiales bacterium]